MILTAVLALSVFATSAMAGGIEGTLVDGKCFLGMGAKGNDHGEMKECGTMCAKMGIPTGVVTADGKYYTLVVPASQVAKYVGQTVKVEGMAKNGNLIAESISVKDHGKWKKVKIGAMM
jgi:hypothetical protein